MPRKPANSRTRKRARKKQAVRRSKRTRKGGLIPSRDWLVANTARGRASVVSTARGAIAALDRAWTMRNDEWSVQLRGLLHTVAEDGGTDPGFASALARMGDSALAREWNELLDWWDQPSASSPPPLDPDDVAVLAERLRHLAPYALDKVPRDSLAIETMAMLLTGFVDDWDQRWVRARADLQRIIAPAAVRRLLREKVQWAQMPTVPREVDITGPEHQAPERMEVGWPLVLVNADLELDIDPDMFTWDSGTERVLNLLLEALAS
jgi:hypothetical protein